MEVSLFLAKFWGWYLLVFFLILSFNPRRIQQIMDDMQDRKFLILVAFIAIVIGLLNILFHNTWEANWTIIITVIGWVALLKGVVLFSFPEKIVKKLYASNVKRIQFFYVLLFLLGLFLLNMGYGIVAY